MEGLSIEVSASGPLIRGGFEEIIFREAESAVRDIAGILEREIMNEAPQGATGALRGSIVSEVRGRNLETLRGEVAATADHAASVLAGREPGAMPPWGEGSPLIRWVRTKLGVSGGESKRVSFLVARAIARKGTKGRDFIGRAMEKSQSAIDERIRRLGADIAEKLSG